ncbi:hypothetical protein D3C72_1113290 [compost metagenome]
MSPTSTLWKPELRGWTAMKNELASWSCQGIRAIVRRLFCSKYQKSAVLARSSTPVRVSTSFIRTSQR